MLTSMNVGGNVNGKRNMVEIYVIWVVITTIAFITTSTLGGAKKKIKITKVLVAIVILEMGT